MPVIKNPVKVTFLIIVEAEDTEETTNTRGANVTRSNT